MVDGSTGLLGVMECGFDPLLIDQSRGLGVPAIVGREKISIHEHRRGRAGLIGAGVEVPEASRISTFPVRSAGIQFVATNSATGSRA